MFSVRQMPWHQEGIVLGDYPGTWAEARVLAGLDWDPVTTHVYAPTGTNPDGTVAYEPIDGWKSISRSDTRAVLSINKDSYTVIGHAEMGEIVEAVAQPHVKWETAGVLDGGRAVWCLALLDEPVTLPGDDSLTLPYLAITNRHDGTAACALRATAVRIVCANTFRAAELEGQRTGATFSFIHTSSWRTRLDEARQAVTGARTEMRRYTELAHQLLGIQVTPRQRELFVTEFIPMPPARSGNRSGGPQRRGSPPGPPPDLRVQDHRTCGRHRLRADAGRG
jgi:phage/plasmid-like protein (TIGR03299 family)